MNLVSLSRPETDTELFDDKFGEIVTEFEGTGFPTGFTTEIAEGSLGGVHAGFVGPAGTLWMFVPRERFGMPGGAADRSIWMPFGRFDRVRGASGLRCSVGWKR